MSSTYSSRAAILCPGPSLAAVTEIGECSCAFAVNGACKSPLSWTHWICADARSVERHYPPAGGHNRRVWMPHDVSLHDRPRPDIIIRSYDLPSICRSIGWIRIQSVRKWTMLHACAILIGNGSTCIDIYGCDLSGDGYYASPPNYSVIGGNRWAEQRKCLERLTSLAAEHGIEIRRMSQ